MANETMPWEDAAANEVAAKAPPVSQSKPWEDAAQPNSTGSIANPLLNAISFGWGDEAIAGMIAGIGAITGDIEPERIPEAFDQVRSSIESDRKAYADQNPKTSIATEVSTAALVGLPKILQGLATKGLTGAGTIAGLEGALYGAGEGGEGFKEGEVIVDPPMIDPIVAPTDISGRVTGAAGTALTAIPMGVGGAKAFDMVAGGLANQAAQKQMVRQGVESPETAGLTLKKPEQKQPVSFTETGDVVEDALQQIPERPQGLDIVKELSPLAPKVIPSKSAEKALFQEVSPRTVTNIREANPATRKAMEQVTKIHWGKLNNITKTDPYLVIGDEFNKRLSKVRESQSEALEAQKNSRKALAGIKGEELSGSLDNIAESLSESFQGKLLTIDDAGNIDFSNVGAASPLKKASNRKALGNVWTQFKNARTADDLHVLRRDIDKMIKFEKGGVSGGVDDDTAAILKGLRSSIRENLNGLSSEYADANRIMSQNLDAFEKLESGMPKLKKLDLESEQDLKTATQYIGQQLRKLDSNYANQAELEAAVANFDNLASEYGGTYPVDIQRLTTHLNEIKLRLGEGKASGFQDKIEAATRRGTSPVNIKGQVTQRVMDTLKPVRGISDEQAYQAILENIKEMNKLDKVK